MPNDPFDHLRVDIAMQVPLLSNAVDDDLTVANLDPIAGKSLTIDDDGSHGLLSSGANVDVMVRHLPAITIGKFRRWAPWTGRISPELSVPFCQLALSAVNLCLGVPETSCKPFESPKSNF
jgi:hypothetical protein